MGGLDYTTWQALGLTLTLLGLVGWIGFPALLLHKVVRDAERVGVVRVAVLVTVVVRDEANAAGRVRVRAGSQAPPCTDCRSRWTARIATSADEVYPGGEPQVRVNAGPMGARLEGAARPGHFDGMLAVFEVEALPPGGRGEGDGADDDREEERAEERKAHR